MDGDEMDELRKLLLAQAFLYDNPEAYTCGVEAALRAIERLTPPPLDRTLSTSGRSAS